MEMDSDPNRNVGRTDLSGKSDSVPAPRETAPIPAVTRPGAGPSSSILAYAFPFLSRLANAHERREVEE